MIDERKSPRQEAQVWFMVESNEGKSKYHPRYGVRDPNTVEPRLKDHLLLLSSQKMYILIIDHAAVDPEA